MMNCYKAILLLFGVHYYLNYLLTVFTFFSCFLWTLLLNRSHVQAAEQNGCWWTASALQLWVLHKDRAIQSVFGHRHRQPPQPQWQLGCQRRLCQHHEQPLQRPGLSTYVHPQWAWRRHLPQTLWWLLQHHHGGLIHKVRIHVELPPQEAVPGLWRYSLGVSLWGGLLWGLQSLF